MHRFILSLIVTAAALTARPAAALEVVASIKPLHSLVAAVMAGTGAPALLLDGAASPHAYALRPSDAKALSAAQVVFLVGGGLETFLDKPLRSLGKGTAVVRMADLPGLTRLPPREGGVWEEDGKHGHGHAHAHAHHKDAVDSHMWLDPLNAKVFVRAAADTLAARDPANAAAYAANAERTVAALESLDAEIGMTLRPLRGIPYLVFHDAYQYFEHRYAMTPAGAVSIDPERQPGARRLQQLRQRIREGGAACIFREPQFSPKLVEMLVEGLTARQGVLDPLGAALPAGPDMYPALLRGLAQGLRDCLAG